MAEWLRRLFAPSIFEDEEKTRMAQILGSIGWVALAAVTFLTLLRMITGGWLSDSSRYFFPAVIGIIIVTQVSIRYGHVRTAGVFLVALLWAALTYQAWGSDGLRDVAILAYPILILLSALLLGWRAGALTGLLSMGPIWYLAFHENAGTRSFILDSPDRKSVV